MDQKSSIIEWVNVIAGLASGVLVTAAAFLLSYRSSWRNVITREFTVKIKDNTKQITGEKVAMISFKYEINCTQGEEISITSMYLKLPNKIPGNVPPNATLGEMFFNHPGKFHLTETPIAFKFNKSDGFTIRDSRLMELINEGKFKKIILVVTTNRYGTICSNSLRIKVKKKQPAADESTKSK